MTTPDQAPPREPTTYIQTVPDHCDRIVWRGKYYGLPLAWANSSTPATPYTCPGCGVNEGQEHVPFCSHLSQQLRTDDAALIARLRKVGDYNGIIGHKPNQLAGEAADRLAAQAARIADLTQENEALTREANAHRDAAIEAADRAEQAERESARLWAIWNDPYNGVDEQIASLKLRAAQAEARAEASAKDAERGRFLIAQAQVNTTDKGIILRWPLTIAGKFGDTRVEAIDAAIAGIAKETKA